MNPDELVRLRIENNDLARKNDHLKEKIARLEDVMNNQEQDLLEKIIEKLRKYLEVGE